MILVENNSLKNKVLDELKKHNNYPMLEKIDFYICIKFLVLT